MAPSRGSHGTPAPHHESHHESHKSDEQALHQQSSSALKNARRNFSYFLNPAAVATATGAQPRFRTRALLRTLRYISQFIFWRVVRWAKYAAVGALVAAISATAVGSVVTGAAWIAAPPTIATSVFASVIWGVGKYMAKKAHKRWEKTGKDEGAVHREDQEDGRETVRSTGSYGMDVGPSVVPW